MARICLSYRRSDSTAIVGRIHDHLARRYGADSVFMDVSGIPYGADFRAHIQTVFRDTKVLIAVIGPQWLGRQADDTARIDDKLDPVRVEIQTALRQRTVVIPVLIDGATMPGADDLPRSIKQFAFRNAMRVDSGVDFHIHIERLMVHVDQMLGIAPIDRPAAQIHEDVTQPRNVPNAHAAAAPTVLSLAMTWCSRLLPYFLATVVLLLLAHYLMIMKLDLDPVYLRAVAIVVPLTSGFLLFRSRHVGIRVALVLGLGTSLAAVAGMMIIVGLIDGHSILPASKSDWQEAFEYVVTITLATAAGSLVARAAYSAAPGRYGIF